MMNGTVSIDVEYSYFQRKVLEITGIDLSSYKSEQMKRRLCTLMTRCGSHNLFEYSRLISQDEARRQEFKDFVTINVSEFFRIPDKFEYLRKRIVPALLEGRRRLNVWSAGCSDGCEPYSLAIMLQEMSPLGQWRILATDIDATVLERARRGIYPESQLRNLSGGQLQKYFVPLGKEFRLADQVKKRIEFKIHDLLRSPYEDDLDLIVCRHVLIYFTEDAKDEIFRRFNSSLRTGGVLFVGGTEMIKMPRNMGYDSPSVSFYQKMGSQVPKVAAVSR